MTTLAEQADQLRKECEAVILAREDRKLQATLADAAREVVESAAKLMKRVHARRMAADPADRETLDRDLAHLAEKVTIPDENAHPVKLSSAFKDLARFLGDLIEKQEAELSQTRQRLLAPVERARHLAEILRDQECMQLCREAQKAIDSEFAAVLQTGGADFERVRALVARVREESRALERRLGGGGQGQAITEFLDRASRPGGAPLSMLTPEVLERLTELDLLDDLRVIRD